MSRHITETSLRMSRHFTETSLRMSRHITETSLHMSRHITETSLHMSRHILNIGILFFLTKFYNVCLSLKNVRRTNISANKRRAHIVALR